MAASNQEIRNTVWNDQFSWYFCIFLKFLIELIMSRNFTLVAMIIPQELVLESKGRRLSHISLVFLGKFDKSGFLLLRESCTRQCSG